MLDGFAKELAGLRRSSPARKNLPEIVKRTAKYHPIVRVCGVVLDNLIHPGDHPSEHRLGIVIEAGILVG